jgi:hypothetical protein
MFSNGNSNLRPTTHSPTNYSKIEITNLPLTTRIRIAWAHTPLAIIVSAATMAPRGRETGPISNITRVIAIANCTIPPCQFLQCDAIFSVLTAPGLMRRSANDRRNGVKTDTE